MTLPGNDQALLAAGPTNDFIRRPLGSMAAPLVDKDGSIRYDYWIRAELWEDGEFVITIGGVPFGKTMAPLDAQAAVTWLLSTTIPSIILNSYRTKA